MLTIPIKNADGEQVCDEHAPGGPVPVTISVSPWWATGSRLPHGDLDLIISARTPVIRRALLEQLVAHVVAWTGFRVVPNQPPLACTRKNVLAVLEGSELITTQVLDAIEHASKSGVLA